MVPSDALSRKQLKKSAPSRWRHKLIAHRNTGEQRRIVGVAGRKVQLLSLETGNIKEFGYRCVRKNWRVVAQK